VPHVAGVSVREGDTVVAGETVIAETARRVPVRNQIDRILGRRLPHVHLEVIASPSAG
jgi:multidrug resistance efflux pump